jgi:uncharacterized membrane protein
MGGDIGEIEVGEWIASSIEIVAIVIIGASMAVALVGTLIETIRTRERKFHMVFKRRMTDGLLMGLDLLIAADIINSVTLDQSLESIAGLGLLVLIRTFLSWTLEMEVEGRWPWQERR